MTRWVFRLIPVIGLLLSQSGCAGWIREWRTMIGESPESVTPDSESVSDPTAAIAYRHAHLAAPGGKVLARAVEMVEKEAYVVGACWDFINEIYNRAGFNRARRTNVYLKPETGLFADPGLIRPGDWVMYRNLPYGEIGHSALFVEWIDFDKRSALTIEYVGRNRRIPGRYREADLTKTWGIIRGRE
jgi:hypothetical protein